MEREKSKSIESKINKFYEENEIAHLLKSRDRARSLTVGTAFGGVVEVGMRGDFASMYCTLQPVEAIEIIQQLAAATGVEIALRPKNDFSSWRGWDADPNQIDTYWAGAARWQLNDENTNRSKLLAKEEEKNSLPESKEKSTEEIEDNNEYNEG